MYLLEPNNNIDLLRKTMDLGLEIEYYFRKKDKLSLTDIKKKLQEQKYIYTEEQLNWALHFLFIKRGVIIKNDFWDHEPIYIKVKDYQELSSYTKLYNSFEVDNYKTKKFLLIADTHIGNEEIEDFKLLECVYNYAIGKGATKCFHMGDLFTGNIGDEFLDVEDKTKQLKRFVEYYPKPSQNEMMTYALLGNNDLEIDNKLWHDGISDIFYDLRELMFVNPSFYMFPKERWTTSFSNKSFHFSHKFYHSTLINNLRIACEEDLLKENDRLDSAYDVYISGHLHNGLIYGTEPSRLSGKEQLFLSVPSTGKLNFNKAIAYLVTLNYSENKTIPNMEVSVLTSDNNYQIKESYVYHWDFNGNNDTNKKIKVL